MGEKEKDLIEVRGLILECERQTWQPTPDYVGAARIIFNRAMVMPPDVRDSYDAGSEIRGKEVLHALRGVMKEAGYEDEFVLVASRGGHIIFVRRRHASDGG